MYRERVFLENQKLSREVHGGDGRGMFTTSTSTAMSNMSEV